MLCEVHKRRFLVKQFTTLRIHPALHHSLGSPCYALTMLIYRKEEKFQIYIMYPPGSTQLCIKTDSISSINPVTMLMWIKSYCLR